MKPIILILSSLIIMTAASASSLSQDEFNSQSKYAKRVYKNLQKSDSFDKDAQQSIRETARLIKTKGTIENQIMSDAIESCKSGSATCNNEITQALTDAYRVNNKSILNPMGYVCADVGEQQYHFLAYGRIKNCGITTIGPGLFFSGVTVFGMLCTHSAQGLNVGAYAQASALIGFGAGVSVGKTGACIIVNFNVGVGFFAGAAIINTKKFN